MIEEIENHPQAPEQQTTAEQATSNNSIKE